MKAYLSDILRELGLGGYLEFVWRTGKVRLVTAKGEGLAVDGRSYHAFTGNDSSYERTEEGQAGEDLTNLVIRWRKRP